jgi:hypothetical protein
LRFRHDAPPCAAARHVGNRPEAQHCPAHVGTSGSPAASPTLPGGKPILTSPAAIGRKPGARRQHSPNDQPGGKPGTSATGRKPGGNRPEARRCPAHVGKPGGKPDKGAQRISPIARIMLRCATGGNGTIASYGRS